MYDLKKKKSKYKCFFITWHYRSVTEPISYLQWLQEFVIECQQQKFLPQRLAIPQPSTHKPGPQQGCGLTRSGPASSREIFKLLSMSSTPGLVSCLAPGQRAALNEAGRAQGAGKGNFFSKQFLQSLQVRNWICDTPVMSCYKEALVLRKFSKKSKKNFFRTVSVPHNSRQIIFFGWGKFSCNDCKYVTGFVTLL